VNDIIPEIVEDSIPLKEYVSTERLFEKNTNPNQIFYHDTNQWLNPFLDIKFPKFENYRGNAMSCISNGVVISLQDQSM